MTSLRGVGETLEKAAPWAGDGSDDPQVCMRVCLHVEARGQAEKDGKRQVRWQKKEADCSHFITTQEAE